MKPCTTLLVQLSKTKQGLVSRGNMLVCVFLVPFFLFARLKYHNIPSAVGVCPASAAPGNNCISAVASRSVLYPGCVGAGLKAL